MPPNVAGDRILFLPIALDMWPDQICFVVVVVGDDKTVFHFVWYLQSNEI
jgi:NAD kinase